MKILLSVIPLVFASCTAQQRADFPIKIIFGSAKYGLGGSYSSKGGLELGVNVDPLVEQSGK